MTERDDPRAQPDGGDPQPQPFYGQPQPSYPAYGDAGAPGGYDGPYGQPAGGPVAPWQGQPYGGAYPPTGGAYPPPGGYPIGPPQPFPTTGAPGPLAPPKSVAVALLLTFLWLGAGHLYAGRTTTGVILLVVDLFLWMLSFFIITLILTIPVWLILWVIAMVTSATAVNDYNTRIGYPRA
ncbi:TM2 domain-containing protein [Frankia sp. AvcI1]|uniref:TM2 domain-containing protein n=1 Tax=Frankia sp. AvcI1 TaxID=573496 RepID=UPI0006EC05EC|nr:TM2 domain-containing protein [Frankia sp. AvcI1]